MAVADEERVRPPDSFSPLMRMTWTVDMGKLVASLPKDPDGSIILVSSDEHWGSRWANPAEHSSSVIEERLKGAKALIDLGDRRELSHNWVKFEPESIFKYSRFIDADLRHDDCLIASHPDLFLGKVVGNHARSREYFAALAEFERRHQGRVQIETQFLRVANILFIHGDQATRPDECYLDERLPKYDTSNRDGRFDEMDTELGWPRWRQRINDTVNRHLTLMIGEQFCLPEICAPKIIKWCHEYDARHPGERSILDGVDHIVSADTHYPFVGFPYLLPGMVSETGEPQPKLIYFHNTGVNVSDLYNPLSLFLNTTDIFAADAKVVKIASITQPHLRWILEESDLVVREEPVLPEIYRMAKHEGRKLNVA